MDQTWSNLLKLDFSTVKKMFLYKVVTFTNWIKMAILFWIRLDQICPKWIKLDQIGSNWIKKDQNGSGWLFGSNQFKLDQIRSTQIKFDQIGSNWFKLNQKRSRWIRLIIWFKSDKISPNWFKLAQIGLNCFWLIFRYPVGWKKKNRIKLRIALHSLSLVLLFLIIGKLCLSL